MLNRLFQPKRGHRVPDRQVLALNLSHVLHERSDSEAIDSAIHACRAHARRAGRINRARALPPLSTDHRPNNVDRWLTMTIGLPHLLPDALGVGSDAVQIVDSADSVTRSHVFFRSPAELSLPDDSARRVGVAALILRPDGRTTHLALAGPFDWPMERDATIRAIERLIQARVGQWYPNRALWAAPSERLLPDEVY